MRKPFLDLFHFLEYLVPFYGTPCPILWNACSTSLFYAVPSKIPMGALMPKGVALFRRCCEKMKKKAAVLLALISISLIATAGIGAVSASDEPVGDVVYDPIADVALSKINLEGHAHTGAIYYGPDAMDHGIPGHAPAGGFVYYDRIPGHASVGAIYYGTDAMDHGIPGHAPAGGFVYYDRIPGHASVGAIYYGPDAMDHGIPGHAPVGAIYYGPDAMDHGIPGHALP
nr:hypothetical membrane protein [uncultured archaeon]